MSKDTKPINPKKSGGAPFQKTRKRNPLLPSVKGGVDEKTGIARIDFASIAQSIEEKGGGNTDLVDQESPVWALIDRIRKIKFALSSMPELKDDEIENLKKNMTALLIRAEVISRSSYSSRKDRAGIEELKRLTVEITLRDLPDQHVASNSTNKVNLKGKAETSNEERDTASPRTLRKSQEQESSIIAPDVTARGTQRIRKPMRSRADLGGDPNAENNRFDVKLGGRVPRELRDKFVATLQSHDLNQGAVLTELIESYLENLDID